MPHFLTQAWNFMMWLFSTDAFWSLLGTFIGAALGIPAGFHVNRRSSEHTDAARKSSLLSALEEAVIKNDALILQLKAEIQTITPYYNVDLTIFEATSSLKYELIADTGLCREVDRLRYELTLLSRKIDLVLEFENNPLNRTLIVQPGGQKLYDHQRPILVGAIESHLEPILDISRALIKRLSAANKTR